MEEQQGIMGMREYRKGNWTVQETMILIEAKKMDDERRKLSKKQAYHNIITTTTTTKDDVHITSASGGASVGASAGASSGVVIRPVTELRWKWVEEYCWRKGCLRSQNQCNDKWDNLMRDYKKIRDYSRNLLINKGDNYDQHEEISGNVNKVKSYWEMDKVERKDKGLPTNMLPQIYQTLFDVVEGSGSGSGSGSTTPSSVGAVAVAVAVRPQSQQFLQLSPPPPPPPLRLEMTHLPFYSPQPQPQAQPQISQVLPTLEIEASEHSQPESSAKRRRKEEKVLEASIREGTSTDAPTTTTTTTTTTPTLQDVSSAICRSASIISEAIQTNEQNEERRHKEIMHIHETRLRFEESRLEVTRQGFNGMTDAINKLANSILTWANTSHRSHQGP